MNQNNPIQERIEQLLVKWTIATQVPNTRIIRILGDTDEQDMLDAFFEYMLAIDTDQEDFVLVLDTPLLNLENFSRLLLDEVVEEIEQWNTADIPENIPFENITWQPDYNQDSSKNVAQLFLNNIVTLAQYLISDDDIKCCVVIRMPQASKPYATKWLEDALKLELPSNIILGIQDIKSAPIFSTIADANPKQIITIYPEFNMDDAMEELAGLGDPTAVETPYRTHLVKLMNAVKKREKQNVSIHSKSCIDIASRQLEKDPNWLIQLVTIYTILYNDQIGYKEFKKAIYFASKAIENALLSSTLINPDMAYRLLGQTYLGRGSLYAVKKNWSEALEDYIEASKAYHTCHDSLMECESLRLTGWAYEKLGNSKQAIQSYIQAYQLIHKIPPETIKGSTFPLVVQKILHDKDRRKQISDVQMDQELTQIFGSNWEFIIDQYGKANKKQPPIYAQ
ncbi:tetratricopeptide repeat protein [Aquimarina rhabdastrellae]